MSKTYNSSYNRLKLPSRTFELIVAKKTGAERKQISLALIHVCALIDLGLTPYIEHV
jgi:hypothetical protein